MTDQERTQLEAIVERCSGNQSDAAPNKARAELQAFILKRMTTSLNDLTESLVKNAKATENYNQKMVWLTIALIFAPIVAVVVQIMYSALRP